MRRMQKYFSTYLEKLEKQDKSTRVALTVAAFGVLLFFGIAITLPFRDTLFAGLFPKDPSRAQTTDVSTTRKNEIINKIVNGTKHPITIPVTAGEKVAYCRDMSTYAVAALNKNTDVARANDYIVKIRATCPIEDDARSMPSLAYGSGMPQLWRIYLTQSTNALLTSQAKTAILELMWLWVNKRSNLPYANLSPMAMTGTDNHEPQTNSAFLLALDALKDAPGYGPDKLLADDNTISRHYNAWLGYWMKYFSIRGREGISVETASPGYATSNAFSYQQVYDLTTSKALKRQAEDFLDLYWADIAQEFLPTGVRGGAEVRAYQDQNSFSGTFSLSTWPHIFDWYNQGPIQGTNFLMLVAAVSSYSPPDMLRAIARDTNKPPFLSTTRRLGLLDFISTDPKVVPIFPGDDDVTFLKLENGGSNIKRVSYVTPEYILGTMQFDSGRKYSPLVNQNRLMGVFFSDAKDSRIIVLGVGMSQADGDVGLTEINGMAGPDAMVVGRDIGAYGSSGTRIFIRDGKLLDNLSTSPDGGWLFTKNDTSLVAIRIADGGYTRVRATYQQGGAKDAGGDFLILNNMWSPVVIQMGRAVDYASPQVMQATTSSSGELTQASPSATPTAQQSSPTLPTQNPFDVFRSRVKTLPFTYTGGKLTYRSLNNDLFEYWSQNTTRAKINNSDNLNPSLTYNSPYMKQTYGQGITTLTYGSQTITLNTDCITVESDTCAAMNPPTPTPTKTPTPTPADKILPVVSLTTPNGKVNAGKKVTIQATASDASGISRVEFYVENGLRCTATTTPYICVWDVPKKEGKKYDLQARAYDTKGNSATSANVRVTSK